MIVLVAAACLSLAAQQPDTQRLDSIRVERLAAVGRLWYAARLFHPYLAYKDIDWDSALVSAIPRINAAQTPDQYATAVQGMLAALGDPVTRVQRQAPAGVKSTGDPDPRFRWSDDSVLVITATNYADLEDWQRTAAKLDSLIPLLPRARGVVFDLRQRVPEAENGAVSYALGGAHLLQRLFAGTLTTPGQRSRLHSGFRGDADAGSGGYYSAWVTQDGAVFAADTAAVWKPTAFIVNAGSELPDAVLALVTGGRARLVIEGEASDASLVSAASLPLADNLIARLRLTELVYPDGTGGLPADTIVPVSASGAADQGLDAALTLVRRPGPSHRVAQPLPARAAPPSSRAYAEMSYPAEPYRLLAAFRIWGTLEYFHAYRRLYDEDWYAVLKTFIPKFAAARDSTEYALTVAEMVSHIHDSHGFIVSSVLRNYWGAATAPLLVRMIQGVPVVTGFTDDSVARAAGVRVGDVITRVDGEPAAASLARRERYLAASTPQGLQWLGVRRLLLGAEGSTAVVQLRGADGRLRDVRLPRRRAFQAQCYGCRTGEIVRLLPGNIGYADLDRMPVSMVDSMFTLFRHAKGIIFDMRGYPQGTAWAIAPRLTDGTSVPAAQFVRRVATAPRGDASTEEGDAEETLNFVQYLPKTSGWRYHGPTVMLIDERTISQAEHTGLFLEAANGTKFIGSPTTGANGDVTSFVVPGGISISFSGHDVRHADGRQLQRVGLKPDVAVSPTITGIRAGKDEVLNAAVAYLARRTP